MPDPQIDGRLDARGRPVIDLPLRGLEDPLLALVDTGFNREVLLYESQARLAGLEVEPRRTTKASRVGQDHETVLLETTGRVDWMGQERIVLIHIIPGPVPRVSFRPSARSYSRGLHVYEDEDGMVVIRGRLTPEAGAVLLFRSALRGVAQLEGGDLGAGVFVDAMQPHEGVED